MRKFSTAQNLFKTGAQDKDSLRVVHKGFQPTSPETMSKTIGRDAKPFLNLNPPKFPDARIDMSNRGIRWLHTLFKS